MNNRYDNRQWNFIAILGFALSVISVPLFFLFVGQLLALGLSILGYVDCRKCNNKGKTLAVIGIIISSILLVAAPIAVIAALKYGIEWADLDLLTVVRVILYLI